MHNKKAQVAGGVGLLLCIVFILSCFYAYFKNVENSLWKQSLNTIVDTTNRGADTFSFYLQRQQEALLTGGAALSQFSSEEENRIRQKLKAPSSSSELTCALVLDNGIVFTTERVFSLSEKQKEESALLGNRGQFVSDSFLLDSPVLTEYVRITMADGISGCFFRCYDANSLYTHFAISYYDNTGYSYVVDKKGNVLMRPNVPDSDKTFKNLFALMDPTDDSQDNRRFSDAIFQQKNDIALLPGRHGEQLVFCCDPLDNTDGWSILSIIPQQGIVRQAEQIVRQTFVLCAGLAVVFFLLLLLYVLSIRRYQARIKKMAYTDPLTGIRNFTKFKLDCESLLHARDAQNYAILYLDIRNFKMINDVFGYETGDTVLQTLAKTLTENTGKRGIVGRVSADKFVILYSYESREFLKSFSASLLSAANHCSIISDAQNHFEIYAGICCTTDCTQGAGINALLDRANIAQRAAKFNPKETYTFYNEDMRSGLLREKEIELHMENALESGEFVVYVQPKYVPQSGQMAGGEALVRWASPTKGLIPPGEFIPLFEKNRFIIQLDHYVFTQVCRQLRSWLDAGIPPLPLSVNVSRVLFYKPDFLKIYKGIKDSYAIPDGLLELEFTESFLFEDLSTLQSLTQQLKEAGFLCSIDDFGAGYSSLNVLKELPVDVLKLDGLFFREGHHPERDHIVIKNIVNMAKELHIRTVSEGVEHWEQVEFLREIGCDLIQGYVYAKPMPMEEYSTLLREATLSQV